MLNKIRQIIKDHQAMNVIRNGHGDAHLIAYVSVDGNGWSCRLFQSNKEVSANDPSKAILLSEKQRIIEKITE